MRPGLTRSINLQDYREFYWLKAELQDFCRQNGLDCNGSKAEISKRIEVFLETGEILPAEKKHSSKKLEQPLSLDTFIVEQQKCSEDLRFFFTSIIGPEFRFTVPLQRFIKENAGKTYQDIVDFWYQEKERKKDSTSKDSISSQFEYNQFIRDYFNDPDNKGKTLQDAILLWKQVKAARGSNKYKPSGQV